MRWYTPCIAGTCSRQDCRWNAELKEYPSHLPECRASAEYNRLRLPIEDTQPPTQTNTALISLAEPLRRTLEDVQHHDTNEIATVLNNHLNTSSSWMWVKELVI